MPGIEFLDPDQDEDAEDEELLAGSPRRAPARHRAPSRRRLGPGRTRIARPVRWAVAGLLALVLAGTVAGLVRSSGDSSRPAAVGASADRGPLAPEAPASAFRVDNLGGSEVPVSAAPEGAHPGTLVGSTSAPVPGCPAGLSCAVTKALPVAVVFAVEARVPGATRFAMSSLLLEGGAAGTILTRTLTARSGALRISVDIHQPDGSSTTRSGRSGSGSFHLVYAATLTGGHGVSVSVSGPESALPSVAAVRALAADRRLLTIA